MEHLRYVATRKLTIDDIIRLSKKREDDRIITFPRYLPYYIVKCLASEGFIYFCGKVYCEKCGCELPNWKNVDRPLYNHLLGNPDCVLFEVLMKYPEIKLELENNQRIKNYSFFNSRNL